jgi:RND family efflux transporter MFP subunit
MLPMTLASSSPSRGSPTSGSVSLRADLASLKIDRSRRRGRGWMARLFISLLLLGLAATAGLAAWKYRDQLRPLPQVKTDTVRVMTQGQAHTVLTVTGYIESRWQASVGAKVAGRIESIPVEEGVRVRKGDVLAVIEHADLQASLLERKAAVEQAKAELADVEIIAEQRARDLAREQRLFAQGAGTQAALEAAETEDRVARARVVSRQKAVALAEARVREVEEAIRNMYILAPFDGTVISKDAEVGETIMPGGMGLASGRGSVATVADLTQLEVDTDVKEDSLGRLRKGQPAEVLVDAVPGKRYRGELREIIPMGDRSRGIVKVKVKILDADERLFPELSATVNFLPLGKEAHAGQSRQQTYLPQAALRKGTAGHYAWKLLPNGQVQRVPVQPLGQPREGLVPIKGALVGGDTVLVDPPADLSDGARVRAAM